MRSLNQRAFELGRKHPWLAFPLFLVFMGSGTMLMASDAAGPLTPEERSEFFAFLARVWVLTTVASLAGMAVLAIRGRLVVRDPAQMALNTMRGARYAWIGGVLLPVVMVAGNLLNPVHMVWSAAPGMVAIVGSLGPLLLWSFVVAVTLRPYELLSSDLTKVAAAKARLATWPRAPRPLSPNESAQIDEGIASLKVLAGAMEGTLEFDDEPKPGSDRIGSGP